MKCTLLLLRERDATVCRLSVRLSVCDVRGL